MVIASNSGFANKKAAASRKRSVPVHPDVECLNRFVSPKFEEHVLNNLATFSSAIEQRPQKDLWIAIWTIGAEKHQRWLCHPYITPTQKRHPCGRHRNRQSGNRNNKARYFHSPESSALLTTRSEQPTYRERHRMFAVSFTLVTP